jgi:hypothetical protein
MSRNRSGVPKTDEERGITPGARISDDPERPSEKDKDRDCGLCDKKHPSRAVAGGD